MSARSSRCRSPRTCGIWSRRTGLIVIATYCVLFAVMDGSDKLLLSAIAISAVFVACVRVFRNSARVQGRALGSR